MITEDRLYDEIINSNKEKEAIQDYYGKIIEQLSSELNVMQQTKSSIDEQKQEKAQEIENQESKENQNNNENPIKLDEKIEEKTEVEEN